MYQKIVDNKMVETAAGTQYSAPVSLGSDNSLLYEVWLVSATALATPGGVTVALQGTNDGQNWTNVSGVSQLS